MVHYVMECLQLMALRKASVMEVTQQAYEDYVADIDADDGRHRLVPHPDGAHLLPLRWGRIVIAFPYRLVDVWHDHRAPIEEDFELR